MRGTWRHCRLPLSLCLLRALTASTRMPGQPADPNSMPLEVCVERVHCFREAAAKRMPLPSARNTHYLIRPNTFAAVPVSFLRPGKR